jgi:EmrB/QacA subfamily drug resistance transporter
MQTDHQKWYVLVCVGIGTFLSSLNTSITNTILPTIEHSFKISLVQSEWIVLIYLLILTMALVPIGRLSDLWGHRRIFLLGFALFTCAAVLCGLSKNFWSLFLGRALLALGGAMILSVGPALLSITFPSEQRGRALGLQALMTYIGLSLGPVLGGVLTQIWGWQSTFLVTVPFGVAGFLAGILVVPKIMAEDHKAPDLKGIILFVTAMAAVTLLLNAGAVTYDRIYVLSALFIVFAAAIGAFIHVERKRTSPMIDLKLFRIRNFGFGSLGAAFNYLCFFLVLFILPFYFDQILHFSALKVGIYLTVTPLVMTVCAPIAGALSDRTGPRRLTMLGMVFSTISLVLFGIMDHIPALTFVLLILGLIFTGLGTGTFAAPNNSAILSAAPRSRQGVASGVLATFRYIGMIAGITIGGSLFDSILGYFTIHHAGADSAFLNAFELVMWIGAVFGILGLACTYAMTNHQEVKQ